MNLLVVGLSHRSAPIAVLEQTAVPVADAGNVLCELLKREHVVEAVLLSTCNRVEVYAIVQTFHGGLSDIIDVLAGHSAIEVDQLSGYLEVRYAAAAVEHLFSVAAGLDSMVVGEQQILSQLRTAYASAKQAGTVGHALHELLQQSLRASKRIRHETAIDAAGASVISEALAEATTLACADRSSLVGQRALVLGSGSMGQLATAWLRRTRVAEIVVCNRTQASAQRLVALCQAQGTPARAVDLDGMTTALSTVDLVICCTSAPDAVLGVEQITDARRYGCGPLIVCDLGLPRNVEPGVRDVPGVTLLDLTNLADRMKHRTTDSSAISTARQLITEEVHKYLAAQNTANVIQTLTALRRHAAQLVDAELVQLTDRLPGLDTAMHDEVTRTLRRTVNKLLHAPTVRIKQLAETGGGQAYADTLRELFELNPEATAAIVATGRSTQRPPAANTLKHRKP
jgi:glutamyl-tRNA reductase